VRVCRAPTNRRHRENATTSPRQRGFQIEGGSLAAVLLFGQVHDARREFLTSSGVRSVGPVVNHQDFVVRGGKILLDHACNRFSVNFSWLYVSISTLTNVSPSIALQFDACLSTADPLLNCTPECSETSDSEFGF